jgi:hypothetical protein
LEIDLSPWETKLPTENKLNISEPIFTDDGRFQMDVTLLHFDADTLQLPPLIIRLNGGDSARTNALEIIVIPTPSPDDLNDMAPIRGIHREPTLWTDYLPMALGLAAIIALILLLFWWYQRSQKRPGSASERLLRKSASDLARQKMAALSRKQLWQKGEIKAYYVELTYILREYLEGKYGIPALESTTSEWVSELQKKNIAPDSQAILAEIGRLADLAKFAKGEPSITFHEDAFRAVERLIQSDNTISK